MNLTVLSGIQNALLQVARRAERSTTEILEATFVDSEPLISMLSSKNNQIIFGRRGTGKTHALKYLQKKMSNENDVAVYVDLRTVGSNDSTYGDPNKDIAERACALLRDLLEQLHSELFTIAVGVIAESLHPHQVTLRLDDFADAISKVRVAGELQIETKDAFSETDESSKSASLVLSESFRLRGELGGKKREESQNSIRQTLTGTERVRLQFGRLSTSISGLIDVLNIKQLWILIDEWSEVPLDLQPFLADLIRRVLLPIDRVTVKIAAIEHRSIFVSRRAMGEYIGLELGADISADLNLDDFLVFDNNEEKAIAFFKLLLFRHLIAAPNLPAGITSADDLIRLLFSQVNAFEEFVRAVEGVPRDALNLIAKAVTRSWGEKITVPIVRRAARDWYDQDKAPRVNDNAHLRDLLTLIIDVVIGNRKARAFLFEAGERNQMLDELYDLRVIHVLKKGVSSHDQPGSRYDVYKIDYGCYVDLINTSKAPIGLLEDDDDFTEVPKDDYRSIRRAILSFST
jgi:hypothetical protein